MAAELDRLGRVVQRLSQAHALMTSARNEPAYSTGRRESVSCDSMRPSLVADEGPKRRSMDDGLMRRPWLPIEQQDSRRPKCEPRAWDDTHNSEDRFSPSGSFSHQTLPLETFLWRRLNDAASEHGNSSLPVDPSSDCQITSTTSFVAEDLLVAVREEQDGSQGIGIRSRTDVDEDDPALMDIDDVMIELGTFLTDDHTHLTVSSETHVSALGTSTCDISQIFPRASHVSSDPATTTTSATRASAPCTRPCDTDIRKDDCFKALSACSVSPEKKEISAQLPPTSTEPAASNHKASSEIKPEAPQQVLQPNPPRKSRKRKVESTAAELQKKNEAEKKRIKKHADVVARLRDELALHTDTSLFDPHGISRNDLLERVLEQLIKNRQSYCALPYVVSLNDLHRRTRHMYTNVGPH